MKNLWRCLCIALTVLTATAAFGLSATVSSTDARVQGLHYDSATSAQKATWSFTCTAGGNYGPLYYCTWTVDGSNAQTSQTNQPFTYTTSGTGKHVIACVLSYGVNVVSNDYTIAAIGGPLSLGVTGKQSGLTAPAHDLNSGATGEDTSKAWYLQYFGYDRSGGTVPAGYQASQFGTVAAGGQPSGTTYGWAAETGLTIQTGTTTNLSTIDVYGTAGTAGAGKKVTCTFHYTDPTDSSLTGSADDDSDETPPPGSSTANVNFYRFDVHAPAPTVGSTLSSHATTTPPIGYAVVDAYTMTLKDDGSAVMPQVWTVERLTNPGGSSGEPCPTSASWTTLAVGTNCGTWIDYLACGPLGSAVVPPAGPWFTETQKYYGGTNDTTNSSTKGILVGTYYPKLWTNSTSHGTTP